MFLNQIKRKLRSVPVEEKVKINLKGINKGHHKVTYKGIKAIRCPFDYVIYQMIIGEVRPDLIIEIGCHEGGGAMYLSDLLKAYNIDGEIHAIDIDNSAEKNVAPYSNIKFFGNETPK